MNAKHVHSVPVIKCFPDLGPTILNILTILNIPCFKYKNWIQRGCRALQQHCSGGCESSEGRKGIPVTVIPARGRTSLLGKKNLAHYSLWARDLILKIQGILEQWLAMHAWEATDPWQGVWEHRDRQIVRYRDRGLQQERSDAGASWSCP